MKDKLQNNWLLFTSGLLLLLLLMVDLFFYKEKLYGDASYYLFQIVNDKGFAIEHRRPIAILIELFPLLLVKLKASLDLIILFFSINQWFYLFSCILLSVLVLKDIKGAVGILFSILLGSKLNYFNPVSELILSAPLFFILLSLLKRQNNVAARFFTFGLILVLVFSHPLNSFLLPLILLFDHLHYKKAFSRRNIALYLYVISCMAIHYYLLDPYEKNPLNELNTNQYGPLEGIKHFNFAEFGVSALTNYLGTTILGFLCLYCLIKEKSYQLLVIVLGFIVGYFFLVLYKFSFLTGEPFERYMFPIPLVLCLYFFNYIHMDNLKVHGSTFFFILVLLLPFYQFYKLVNYGLFVKNRYSYLEGAISYAQQFKDQKVGFRVENYYTRPKGHDWIMSNESLLLSASNKSQQTRQVFVIEGMPGNAVSTLPSDCFFYAPWWGKNIQEFNPDYFMLREGPIRFANTDSIQSSYPDSFFKNISITIGGPTTVKAQREYLFPITIYNLNHIPLTSGRKKEQVHLSYYWSNMEVNVNYDGIRSPVLADVYTSLDQEVIVKSPAKKGIYKLQIAVVYEDKKWCEVNSEKLITVE